MPEANSKYNTPRHPEKKAEILRGPSLPEPSPTPEEKNATARGHKWPKERYLRWEGGKPTAEEQEKQNEDKRHCVLPKSQNPMGKAHCTGLPPGPEGRERKKTGKRQTHLKNRKHKCHAPVLRSFFSKSITRRGGPGMGSTHRAQNCQAEHPMLRQTTNSVYSTQHSRCT